MFTSLFNFSVFILRHFIKTRTIQSTLQNPIGYSNQNLMFGQLINKKKLALKAQHGMVLEIIKLQII